jgi:hypothetical protein|nr:MAG TPA: secretion system protein [Caudoviricetes sp.]
MADRPLYIIRPEGDDLYTILQRRTLAELQRLAGEVWTDYNPHDPGVTVADAVNYALTETDYKLGFGMEDYLTDTDGTWPVGRYGLFPVSEVYPSAPVTTDDYRRLILARFPMVQNVDVIPDPGSCSYNFILRLSPFFTDEAGVTGRVRSFLNRHRNLCETIGGVTVGHPEKLTLEAELEILPGCNATEILVQIYWTAMQYLSGSVQLEVSDSGNPEQGPDLSSWYDGPVKDVRAVIPLQRNTERELYWRLNGIEGIRGFKACWFRDTEGRAVTDFKDGYMLRIPDSLSDMVVTVRGERVYADVDEFKERLKAKYFLRSTMRMRHLMQEHGRGMTDVHGDTPVQEMRRKARYRDVYGHYPVAGELPECYRTSDKDFVSGTPAARIAEAVNFGSYLRLFDLLMERGMGELAGLKSLLSIEEEDSPSRIPTLPEGTLDMRKRRDRQRNVSALKDRYMDFLDGLYGTDSNPLWLREFDYYSRTEDDRLKRRMAFLRELPRLIRYRSRGVDITGTYGGENVPAVKRHLSLLLGFNCDEEVSVGNILPGHNLILMGDGEKGHRMRELMNSAMIDDSLFDDDMVEAIEPDDPPGTEEERLRRDEDLRRSLPIFNSNWISGSLFREGIRLGNYNLVPDGSEWILAFRGREERLRMNLGRSDDKERLRGWANTLCRYLRGLNRQCEAVYVVEKSLFEPAERLSVLLVFSGWTARTHSPRFRDACTQLARSVIPAHLKMETCWLNASRMQRFEECYRKWRDCLAGRLPEEMRAGLQKDMTDVIDAARASEAGFGVSSGTGT